MENNLIIVDFNPPMLDPSLVEALKEEGINIADLKPERIKIAPGGVLSYIFPNKPDGSQDLRSAFNAVVIFNHDCNAYWADKKGNDSPPDCSSFDGITGQYSSDNGSDRLTRDCATCPHNQYGTGTDQNGNRTKGKACKNMHRLYVVTEDEMVRPKLLNLPPSSLNTFAPDWKARNIVMAKRSSFNTLIKISLFGKKIGPNDVAIAKFEVVGAIKPEVAAYLKAMQQEIKAKYKEVSFTGEDYNTEHSGDAASGGNGVDINKMNFNNNNLPPTGTESGQVY